MEDAMRASIRVVIVSGRLVLACLVNAIGVGPVQAENPGLAGDWITADGSTKVRFAPCGENVCGRIVWLREAVDPATRQPWLDSKNDDARLRGRQLIGLTMLADVKRSGDATWSASLYNPLDGKTYSGTLRRLDEDRLELTGCALVIICQSETWRKSQ
jgi:uncharacterized protein (DUF2147 family)